jgi:hypothetical protein
MHVTPSTRGAVEVCEKVTACDTPPQQHSKMQQQQETTQTIRQVPARPGDNIELLMLQPRQPSWRI